MKLEFNPTYLEKSFINETAPKEQQILHPIIAIIQFPQISTIEYRRTIKLVNYTPQTSIPAKTSL